MNSIFVVLKTKEFRKIASLDNKELIFPLKQNLFQETVDYKPGYKLEEEEWFKIANFSKSDYVNSVRNLLNQNSSSVNFDSLTRQEFEKIDFLFTKVEQDIFFQNIPKSQLIRKK